MPLSDIVAHLEPEVEPVQIMSSRRAAARLEVARQTLDRAKAKLERATEGQKVRMSKDLVEERAALDAAQAEVDAAHAEALKHRHVVWIRQLGNERWKELIWRVPPTDDQKGRVGRGLDHNPELFPIVALAFSFVDVEADDEGHLRQVVGPAIEQSALDKLDEALKKANGDPDAAVKAADNHMPEEMIDLNRKIPAGEWERLVSVLYSLNVEATRVPLL